MFDWKENAEKMNQTDNQARENREAAEHQGRLLEFQRKYRCHICNNPGFPDHFHDSDTDRDYGWNWDKPGNLSKCKKCGKWACVYPEHIHVGICMKCAGG